MTHNAMMPRWIQRGRTTMATSTVHCECGQITGTRCDWSGPKSETVVIEHMPMHLRASHTAAGNRGQYPSNGAIRIRVNAECGGRLIADDDEGDWTTMVL